ncbi:MAG: hypothetical protein ACJA2S_005536 [Cyclobacteriaceae bacterium]|jgi:hypothetical protein
MASGHILVRKQKDSETAQPPQQYPLKAAFCKSKSRKEKVARAKNAAEWAGSRSSCTKVSDRQFGHSQYRLLYAVYFFS